MTLTLSSASQVCEPGTDGYNDAVNIWNAVIDRRPSLVARCGSAEDVAAALTFAREHALEVSVRGGGHNYSGSALTDGGLMIDLTPMKQVRVDADAKRAWVGGGTTWGEVDAVTQQHGLAIPGGFISHTGVGGLTLGGGIGWLTRLGGLSCDSVVGATLVTADGTIRHVSADEEPELFWAIKGGGGNFGIVTEFEFQLHAVGPMIHLGLFLFDPADGRAMFEFARDYVETLPDTCSPFLAGLNAPPAPFVPEKLHFTPAFGLLVAGFGSAEEHAAAIAPITEALSPTVAFVTPMPYVDLQQMFNDSAPWGMYSYEKAAYLEELSDGAIDAILEHQARKVSPLSFVPIFTFGGAFRAADPDGSAFGGRRTVKYVLNISGTSPTPDGYEAEREWARAYWSALQPFAEGIGGYVNFQVEEDEARVAATYSDKYARLQRIKREYDPDNVFHLYANIPPA